MGDGGFCHYCRRTLSQCECPELSVLGAGCGVSPMPSSAAQVAKASEAGSADATPTCADAESMKPRDLPEPPS